MRQQYGDWKDWLLCLAIIVALQARLPSMANRNPKGRTPRKKDQEGDRPGKFALGFFLGAFITVLVALITWGSPPTAKRLAIGVGLLFLCGIYPTWYSVGVLSGHFDLRYSLRTLFRLIALIVLAGIVFALWKELLPPQPLITMQIRPSNFPVSIPPHSVVSIFQVHPYIGLTEATDGLLKDTNDKDTAFLYPSDQEIATQPKNAHEDVYRFEVANHAPQTLIGGKIFFQEEFAPGASYGCTATPDNAKYKEVILVPPLDPGRSFEFYAINQSTFCAWLIPPSSAMVRMANDDAEQEVPLVFDKNPLYNAGAPSFMTTTIKWEGLPTKPGVHYVVKRIVH